MSTSNERVDIEGKRLNLKLDNNENLYVNDENVLIDDLYASGVYLTNNIIVIYWEGDQFGEHITGFIDESGND